MQQERKLNKNKSIIITLILIILLIAIIGLSYAYWTRSFEQTGSNINEFDCFDINFVDGDAFNLTDMYPQTNSDGLENTPYEVKIENTCGVIAEYSILINEDKSSTLNISNVNFGVNKTAYRGSELEDSQYYKKDTDETYDVKVLATGFLFANENKTLDIRAWMDENTSESDGLGRNYKFKVIIDAKSISSTSSIATNVLANNPIQSDSNLDFAKGYPNDTSISGLYVTEDDSGTSYYFRGDGNLLNNNVTFANMDWRIVRINGDGSIRLILDEVLEPDTLTFNYYLPSSIAQHDKVGFTYGNTVGKECTKDHPCEVTYNGTDFSNKFGGTNSDIKTTLETWYNDNLKSYDDKIAYGLFCNDVSYGHGVDDGLLSTVYYGAYERIWYEGVNHGHPTLVCPEPNNSNGTPRTYGGLYKTKIGLITADEVNMGGIPTNGITSPQNYLRRDFNYLTITPYTSDDFANIFTVNYIGQLLNNYVFNQCDAMPVINLKANVKFTGSGTADDPYKVISN